jgi:hypothetical protein
VLDSYVKCLPVVVNSSWNVTKYKNCVPPHVMAVKWTNEIKKWELNKRYIFILIYWTSLNCYFKTKESHLSNSSNSTVFYLLSWPHLASMCIEVCKYSLYDRYTNHDDIQLKCLPIPPNDITILIAEFC